MKIIAISTLLVNLIATNALADELKSDAPFNWTGSYLGAQGGYAWGNSTGGGVFLLAPGSDVFGDIDPKGALGGIYAGYNFQLDNRLVIGIEGDINYSRVKGASVLSLNGTPLPPNKMSAEMDWNASIRGRAGYAIDRFLPYATAGVAFGKYAITPNYALTDPLSDSTVQSGLTIGAGLEYAITDRLITRFEYRYTDFGDASYKIPGFKGLFESKVDLKTQDIKVGLSYKF
ncbi:porin family protein [Rhizobium sp. KVB221]|uniref:Porin family protein n=1 Tax=Rhizobium setariae TaxID=2801340 RepID=A0A936YRT5_9HYPH|nr:outer membrane protein [Rhizobium setariae]MBL0371626.1 porin family protein [Rhizobium setariae]